MASVIIRDGRPEDAPFLAKCVMAGMHYYDFELIKPEMEGFYQSLVDCERRTDLLYTFADSRVAEIDGKVAGSLLSYPGDNYKELRHKTFSELWPNISAWTPTPSRRPDRGNITSTPSPWSRNIAIEA